MSLWQDIHARYRSTAVTIAIAGLSRAGKTALITSLITNLEAAGDNPAARGWLRGLEVVDDGRLCSARQPSAHQSRHGRAFPYSDMLTALTADEPSWPERTANIYEAAIDVHFWPNKRPSSSDAPTACLRINLVDYPGEWLADLPMVRQTYVQWSDAALKRLSAAPWSGLSRAFLEQIACTSWSAPNHDQAAKRAASAWQDLLASARGEGLKWLQPAQFIRKRDQPDGMGLPNLDEQALWFCPLPGKAIADAKKGSLARTMADRYEAYRTGVARFFGETLKDASRHVLLVDVLEAMAEGQHAFRETSEVLGEVYHLLADTNSGLFRKMFSRAGFDKVLLIATKADTVPASQRAALASLLRDMCSGRIKGAAKISLTDIDHIAAVRATRDVEIEGDDGFPVKVVQGKCADTGKIRQVKLFGVPDRMPMPEDFARRKGLRPPRFVPPKVQVGGQYGVPNARLGTLLQTLVGDLVK